MCSFQIVLLKHVVAQACSSISVAMAAKYNMGTPLGGERKMRRMRSPLQQMDGVVGELQFSDEEDQPVPTTPKEAQPMTMAGIAALLSPALAPFRSSMNEVKAEVASLRAEVEEIESMNHDRNTNLKTDVESLRAEVSQYNGEHQALELKVGKLEEIFESLAKQGTTSMPRSSMGAEVADREHTAVLGGLSSLPGEKEAFQWF